MRREIIVTDLTRFSAGNIHVCMAGIDLSDGICIRPMPYLDDAKRSRDSLRPGSKLVGDFWPPPVRRTPHMEDCQYDNLSPAGYVHSNEFRDALLRGLQANIEEGFNFDMPEDCKFVPPFHPVHRSIITIRVEPTKLHILSDRFGKLKAHFHDSTGRRLAYVPVTDLAVFDHVENAANSTEVLRSLNAFVAKQEEVLLRVGLSRNYRAQNGNEGHWIQLNGIYTFPDPIPGLRI